MFLAGLVFSDIILETMRYWESKTCLRFQQYNTELGNSLGHHARVNFIRGDGCYSYIGVVNIHGPQDISIGNGCQFKGTIAHELGHVIGFWHEQSRPDRDNYVRIHTENIKPGYEGNFKKYTTNDVDTYGIDYDISSIMHYGSHFFSTNQEPTITTVNEDDLSKLGQRDHLTFSDIKLANTMYKCSEHCGTDVPYCGADGYVGPKCTCVCHHGVGDDCHEPRQCYSSYNGEDYRGGVNVTIGGLECQMWSDQSPWLHTYVPENYPDAGVGDHNYCRNPDGDDQPWCITLDDDIDWQYCDIGQSSDTCLYECYLKRDGTDYFGTVDITTDGTLCQKWSEQSPHTHEYSTSRYPKGGLGDHRYCRNPDFDDAPWCFTSDPDIRWQYCDVGQPTENCGETECYTAVNGNDYRGSVHVTQSLRECRRWTHSNVTLAGYTLENYPNAGLGDHNFCRNPDGEERPWCFISGDPSNDWELCDVRNRQELCGPTECYLRPDGSDYRGTVNTTSNGHACMNWSDDLPNILGYNVGNFPAAGLGDHNSCRNPDGGSQAWCFSTNPDEEWNTCDIGLPSLECE
uniref:Metalloendopeptidase n=1 Tax=Saccoglossus kowalevskii TaxID=10224 RepID=A0ABM0MRM1_SACKO|nr:PREDICTED: plasminogen-like [Saccoglossus kowalevskii]